MIFVILFILCSTGYLEVLKTAALEILEKSQEVSVKECFINPLNASVANQLTGFYMRATLAFNGLILHF